MVESTDHKCKAAKLDLNDDLVGTLYQVQRQLGWYSVNLVDAVSMCVVCTVDTK